MTQGRSKIVMKDIGIGENCFNGISLPGNADIELSDLQINCQGLAIEVRDHLPDLEARVLQAIEERPGPERRELRSKWERAKSVLSNTGSAVAATAIAHYLGLG